MTRSRRGQASVEYMLLLCSVVAVVCISGYFLKNYADVLMEKIGERIMDVFLILAFG